MKIAKKSSNNKSELRDINSDLIVLFTAMQGRIRFGTGTDGDRGENLHGEFQKFTTSGTPNAENTIAHGLGSVPRGYIILGQDKAGSLYQLNDTGSAWTITDIFLKSDIASVTFLIFLLK